VKVVRDPDGREWTVRLRRFRRPGPTPEHEEQTWLDRFRAAPLWGPLAAGAAAVVRVTVAPVLAATLGRRPWIEASSRGETLVWRATGRSDPQEALEEIASALERGDPRPRPLEARWVGREGGRRLPPRRG
jgi:hypothetical protein